MATVPTRSLSDYPVSLQLAARAIYGDHIRREAEATAIKPVQPANVLGKQGS